VFIGPTKRYLSNAARLYLNERLILYCATLPLSGFPLSLSLSLSLSAACILPRRVLDIYRIQRATTGPRNFNARGRGGERFQSRERTGIL